LLQQILNEVTLNSQIVIIVPALLFLGYALKRTPKVKDWWIIWILLISGVCASGMKLGFNVNGISNGIIAAGIAITSQQTLVQGFPLKKNTNKE
jgi:hypothetical protein